MDNTVRNGLILLALGLIAWLVLHVYHLKGAALMQAAKQDTLDTIHEGHLEVLKLLALFNGGGGAKPAQGAQATVAAATPGAVLKIDAAPPVVENCNGVPVPEGMTLASFTALVTAIQGAAAMLANDNLHAALLASTQAWWDNLGPYFREALLALSGDDVFLAFHALSLKGVPLITLTPAQRIAAKQAAGITP